MPTTTISSNIITSAPIAIDLISEENLVIQAGVLVSTTGGIGVQAATGGIHAVTVRGELEANTGVLYDDSFGALTITGTGSITGTPVLNSDNVLEGGLAVFVRGASSSTFQFNNAGTIDGYTTALAVVFDGRFVGTNTGTITSEVGDAVAIGVRAGGSFTNNGLIETSSTISNAVDLFFTGVGGTVVTFVNNGTIRSNGDDALDMDSNDANRSFNFGTIDGGVVLGSQNDFFRQAGTLNGDILMGDGDDRFSGGTGSTNGTVFAGTGNDIIIGGASADLLQGEGGADLMRGNSQRDTIYGGFGQDTIRGDAFNDLIGGGGGRDELRGGSGSDLMYGGTENDLMFGQSGRDQMYGGAGDDTMSGGSFSDTVNGGDGNDVIDGGEARDTIVGGLGVDLLTGGDARDTFVWNSAAESATMATRDRVLDFGTFAETLDFRAVTGPVIDYRGTNGFTGTGIAELRIFENNFGNTMVQVDVNGDGNLDMVVQVNGQGLTEDNFLL